MPDYTAGTAARGWRRATPTRRAQRAPTSPSEEGEVKINRNKSLTSIFLPPLQRGKWPRMKSGVDGGEGAAIAHFHRTVRAIGRKPGTA